MATAVRLRAWIKCGVYASRRGYSAIARVGEVLGWTAFARKRIVRA
jgi:hypothetical protein